MPNLEEEQKFLAELKEYEKQNKYEASLMPQKLMNKFNAYLYLAGEDKSMIGNPELRSYMSLMKDMIDNKSYSGLNSMSSKIINVLASKAYYDELERGKGNPENPNRCLDPFYRTGLELAAASPFLTKDERKNAQEISERMNETVLQNTLAIEDSDAFRNAQDALKKGDSTAMASTIKRVRLEQSTIAKTLFLTHLGMMYTMQTDGRNAEFKGSVAESMGHGGRTLFVLPKGDPEACEEFKKYYFHNINNGQDLGTAVTGRTAATHSASTGKAEKGEAAYKESGSTSFSGNYQMNPAIGGLGKNFGDKPILNDGRNGQVFMQVHTGDREKNGYLMVGFENEESLTKGRTGHWHTPVGTESKYSCFMASKGGPGAAKNGRLVDLSAYNPLQLNAILEKFSEAYQKLQYMAGGSPENSEEYATMSGDEQEAAADKLNKVNKALCGKIMDREMLIDLTENVLGIKDEIQFPGHVHKRITVKDVFKNAEAEEKIRASYKELNSKAEKKLADMYKNLGAPKLSLCDEGTPETGKHQVAPGMQKMLNALNKASGRFYDLTSESDKMAKIKLQLTDLTYVSSQNRLAIRAAEYAFRNLCKSCADYIYDPSKNNSNDRMKAVKAVFQYASNEMKNLGLDKEIDGIINTAKTNNAPGKEKQAENNAPEKKLTDQNVLQ